MREPWIDLMVSKRQSALEVVRVALGITAYVAEPMYWATDGAAKLLQFVLEQAPDAPLWYRTSLLTDWNRIATVIDRDRIVAALAAQWIKGHPRHFFSFEVADDPQVPSFGFSYVEIDPRRATRPSVIEVTLPQDFDPERLASLAGALGDLGPFLAAVGGYAARWNPQRTPLAFAQIRLWCKRFVGLDAQNPDRMAWALDRGLPGTSWLTLIGATLQDRLKIDGRALAAGPWASGVSAVPLAHGLLLRAGERPSLGDVNSLETLPAYVEVARRLEPWLMKDPPELPGVFGAEKNTLKWFRRFVEPGAWGA